MKRGLALLLCAVLAAAACCAGSSLPSAWAQPAREGITVSAEDFGAYGADDEDDRAAVQTALNFARDNATASSPVTVTLGDGIYYFSESVLIYSHTRLLLSDNAVLCFRDSPEGIILQGGDASQASYDTLTDIVISGGIWRGNASLTGAHTELIGIKSASGVTISGLTMEDSSDHFIMLTGVSNAVVRDCSFSRYVPISRIDQFVKEAVHIDFLPLGDDALFPSKDITVENCVFDNVASGIGTHHYGYGKYETNITVCGCTFSDLLYNCINSYSMAGLSVSDCEARNCDCFLWMRGSCGTFDAVTVSGCGQRGFQIHDGSSVRISNSVISNVGGGSDEKAFAVLAADSAVMVEGSSISDVAGTAIRVKNSDMLSVISGNVITRADGQGMFVSDTVICIKDNTVSDCEGIWTECAESEITGNDVSNCMYGIADHCGHSHIFGNKISQTYDYGIKITGTEEKNGSSVVEGNSVSASGRENVRIGTKCSGCLVRNNNIGLPFSFSYSKWSDLTAWGNGENPPPAAPEVNCFAKGGSVFLSWERVSGAAYYAVCEVDPGDGSLTKLTVTKKLQCRLENPASDQKRTFLVLSCAADGTPCFYTIPTNSVKAGGRAKGSTALSLPIDFSPISGKATGQIQFIKQSGDATAIQDGIVSLAAAAKGVGLSGKWYFKKTGALGWSLLKGHNELWEYVIADASWDGAQVFCAVHDGKGGQYRTTPVTITVRTPLRIVSEPADVIADAGAVVRFSVKAAGKGRLQYRWYYKKADAVDWSLWKGHNEPTLAAEANDTWQGMQVKCVIFDDSGNSVETRTVNISIEQLIG